MFGLLKTVIDLSSSQICTVNNKTSTNSKRKILVMGDALVVNSHNLMSDYLSSKEHSIQVIAKPGAALQNILHGFSDVINS